MLLFIRGKEAAVLLPGRNLTMSFVNDFYDPFCNRLFFSATRIAVRRYRQPIFRRNYEIRTRSLFMRDGRIFSVCEKSNRTTKQDAPRTVLFSYISCRLHPNININIFRHLIMKLRFGAARQIMIYAFITGCTIVLTHDHYRRERLSCEIAGANERSTNNTYV